MRPGRLTHRRAHSKLSVMALLAIGLFAGVGSAHAQEPDPNAEAPAGVDPDTPAGIEYQLPLQRTRRETAGRPSPKQGEDGSRPEDGGDEPDDEVSLPLFGVGVGKKQSTGGTGPGDGRPPRNGQGESTSGDGSGATIRSAALGDGRDPTLTNFAIAGGVLLLGAAGGLLLRRRRGPA